MIRITDILDKVLENHPDADVGIIDRAYIFSARVHDGQIRLSGEPYLSHPLEVAGILADMKLDSVSIAAGLLHDVIEDTHATEAEIDSMFGREVLHIVAGLTKLSKLTYTNAKAREAESFRKMLLAMADDIRVILIKLADRLHNMRTLQYHQKEDKKKKIARETLEIYAPIAARLGIYWIKTELENSAFSFLDPDAYTEIQRRVAKDKEDRENYILQVKTFIQNQLAENGLTGEVSGRYKHFYGIHQKMLKQNLPFEEVYDIIAFRIILDTVPRCYEALGLMHTLWRPIAGKFKDYIGMPKPNGYQSLHTTVIGPSGQRIEIQIRTQEMDRVARSGIAAHWSYKEGRAADENMSRTFAWIQNLVENQESLRDPSEFLENVRIDLFPDEIYVFTPKGEIKTLIKGATPVDFAYMIHSEVGDRCAGAKVNGHMVSLRYELQTGQIVEIITHKGAHPSKDWLTFVKTVKARSRIRQWFKTEERVHSLTLGREICEKAFRKARLNFNTWLKGEDAKNVLESFGLKTLEDLIASVGYGKITPTQVITRLAAMEKEKEAESGGDTEITTLVSPPPRDNRKRNDKSGVVVKGVDDVLVHFGKCCQPVPGDPITGYITRGHGVTIHRATCRNALRMDPERRIDVEWGEDTGMAGAYPVKILVKSMDRAGLLADVAAHITRSGADILVAKTETKKNQSVDGYFTVLVRNTDQLSQTIEELKQVRQVVEVIRLG